VVASAGHRALAREVAGRSMVLLRNEPVGGRPLLPLDRATLGRLAVLGRLADLPNTGDHGSSDVRAPEVVTPLAGLRAALPGVSFVDDPAGADAAVVVVGYTAADEGEYVGSFDAELATLYPPPDDPDALADLARAWDAGPQAVGGDRDSLRLHPEDEQLIRTVAAANPRTVVVVVAGAAVTMEAWRHQVPAILLGWYSGMEGGTALADVLLGDREPGGRLPFAIPRDEADLPPFDRDATTVTYDRWHGQRLLDRTGTAAAYPLGFGLSYTSFALSDASAAVEGDVLAVRVTVADTGDRAGGQVVQAYATRPGPDGVDRFLVGFTRVELAPGERAPATIEVPVRRLAARARGRWQVPPGPYRIEVAGHAADPAALTLAVELPS
jgi:beta-glucosidase